MKLFLSSLMGLCLLAACASTPDKPMNTYGALNADDCAAKNGDWIPFSTLRPNKDLNAAESARYICNLKTNDAGKTCAFEADCESVCLAQTPPEYGKEATGHCAPYVHQVPGTVLVERGYIRYPAVSRVNYPAKLNRLDKLAIQKKKWLSHKITNYKMKLSDEASFYAFGPFNVTIKDNEISTVFHTGENQYISPPHEKWAKESLTLDGIFSKAVQLITDAPKPAKLIIEYDKTYGFVRVLGFDRPDMNDEQFKLIVTDFTPNSSN